ncbi:type VI secretion system baseplate subunit TssG [Burkholderia pyrrocinia]|uniref:type VI secretion system baseplate subunit TssG n=1 Tax=Burkholderia pyrrocinia TaxID=60550 RepID=UPI0015894FD6|nr:type VI secretion system baseplate subunit TssG [Burkholderia pyrrocinia]
MMRAEASELPAGLSPQTLARLQAEPWREGFFALVRRLAAHPSLDPVGRALRPQAEPFRFGQQPSLAFAPREIADARVERGRLKLRVTGLGMLGPNGPLPRHVTEIARNRSERHFDPTLVDFFDLFHHRYLTLLYRAWAAAQASAGLDRPDAEPFSFYVASLVGLDMRETASGLLPTHALLGASAHRVREARNPEGLRATLERYFGVPVVIEEYVWHWIAVDAAEHCRLGDAGAAAQMAQGAMLGELAPDRQCRFRLVIGPLDIGRYLRFTPRGEDLPRLVEWVRAFVGDELAWEVELRIAPGDVPPAMIGDTQQLGWSAWLGGTAGDALVTGMRFEPEQYGEPQGGGMTAVSSGTRGSIIPSSDI